MTSAPPALQYVLNAIKTSPWIHLAVLPPALAVALSYAASATPAEQAAAWSAATVVGTVAAGLLQRPVHVAVSAAAVTTVAGDLAVLGLHLPASAAGAALAVLSVLSPVASRLAPGGRAAPPPAPVTVVTAVPAAQAAAPGSQFPAGL